MVTRRGLAPRSRPTVRTWRRTRCSRPGSAREGQAEERVRNRAQLVCEGREQEQREERAGTRRRVHCDAHISRGEVGRRGNGPKAGLLPSTGVSTVPPTIRARNARRGARGPGAQRGAGAPTPQASVPCSVPCPAACTAASAASSAAALCASNDVIPDGSASTTTPACSPVPASTSATRSGTASAPRPRLFNPPTSYRTPRTVALVGAVLLVGMPGVRTSAPTNGARLGRTESAKTHGVRREDTGRGLACLFWNATKEHLTETSYKHV
jgi:hypothetical protein